MSIKNKIPQFDLLSLGAQIFGLLVSFSMFYYYNIEKKYPYILKQKNLGLKKFKQVLTK